ncbi:hypothetical protein PRNP1_005191 [Phytophthora ramorum]
MLSTRARHQTTTRQPTTDGGRTQHFQLGKRQQRGSRHRHQCPGREPRLKYELSDATKTMRAAIPSYQQREKRGKRAKNPEFKPKRSRKSCYNKVKKPVRDSKRVYNIPRMQTVFIDTYLSAYLASKKASSPFESFIDTPRRHQIRLKSS